MSNPVYLFVSLSGADKQIIFINLRKNIQQLICWFISFIFFKEEALCLKLSYRILRSVTAGKIFFIYASIFMDFHLKIITLFFYFLYLNLITINQWYVLVFHVDNVLWETNQNRCIILICIFLQEIFRLVFILLDV